MSKSFNDFEDYSQFSIFQDSCIKSHLEYSNLFFGNFFVIRTSISYNPFWTDTLFK